MDKKPAIKAKSDACYKEYNDSCYIGIGLSIRQYNGLQFVKDIKYIVENRFSSEYAELVGIIELLKKLQKMHKENIIILGDDKPLIEIINRNMRNKRYECGINRFSLEFKFLYFLINRIKENENTIQFHWQPREHNRECDRLSKKTEEYALDYELNNGEIGVYRFKAYNEIEAQKKYTNYVNVRNKQFEIQEKIKKINIERIIEIPIEKPIEKKQSRSMLNKMLKIFKRTGRAYA